MILDKPLGVGHFDEQGQRCIYSVHIHPDGSRFATGGGDHTVKIWSMDPFRASPAAVRAAAATGPGGSSRARTASSGPSKLPSQVQGEEVKVLASLPDHTGSVLCVRWSHDGRYLASTSDDSYIFIWELRPADAAGFGSLPGFLGPSDTPNVENWARVRVLRGHAMDVLDCTWSPDDSMLASCSIDNTVIIWRMPTPDGDGGAFASSSAVVTPFQFLKRHKSFVKGVAWDPLGRYVASIGADNQLLIWRVGGSWDVEATISAPFRDCEDTLVRRISWSPSGQSIVATNSKDGDVHRAVVISRGRWDEAPASLLGHSECTLTAGFSPVLYRKIETVEREAGSPDQSPRQKRAVGYPVVAVAGRDNVITIWVQAASRPVVVLREVFQQPPSDLSWGADGYTLVVSGHDGSVIVLRCTPEELGSALREGQGKDAAFLGGLALTLDGAPVLVDNPRQLALERSRKEQQKRSASSGGTSRAAPAAGAVAFSSRTQGQGTTTTRPLQVESRKAGGKRRIQPMLVSSVGGAGAGPSQPPAAIAAANSSAIVRSLGGGGPADGLDGEMSGGTVVRLKQTSALPIVSPAELMPRRGASGSLVRQISDGKGDAGNVGVFRPSSRLQKAPSSSVTPPFPREGGIEEGKAGMGAGAGDGVEVMECCALDEDFRGLPARRYTLVTVTRSGREAWRDYAAGMVSACCGNPRVAAIGMEDGSIYIYDRNGVRTAPPLVISPPVAYLECSGGFRSYARQLPQSQPPADPTSVSDHLMAISGDGVVFVWNLGRMSLVAKSSLGPLLQSVTSGALARQSPAPSTGGVGGSGGGGSGSSRRKSGDSGRATGPEGEEENATKATVARAGVTAEGMPLVMLACPRAFGGSLQAFALHSGLGTWIRVADGRFALSDFYSSGPCTSAGNRGGVLSALQNAVRTGSSPGPQALLRASRAGTMAGSSSKGATTAAAMAGLDGGRRESLQSAVTRGHLEESLANAALLGSAAEFADVLKAYAGHLAKNAEFGDSRIRALCDKLLPEAAGPRLDGALEVDGFFGERSAGGPASGGAVEAVGLRFSESPSITGLNKADLLRDVVLPALSGNRRLQRLVSEYYDTLEFFSEAPRRPPKPAIADTARRESGAVSGGNRGRKRPRSGTPDPGAALEEISEGDCGGAGLGGGTAVNDSPKGARNVGASGNTTITTNGASPAGGSGSSRGASDAARANGKAGRNANDEPAVANGDVHETSHPANGSVASSPGKPDQQQQGGGVDSGGSGHASAPSATVGTGVDVLENDVEGCVGEHRNLSSGAGDGDQGRESPSGAGMTKAGGSDGRHRPVARRHANADVNTIGADNRPAPATRDRKGGGENAGSGYNSAAGESLVPSPLQDGT